MKAGFYGGLVVDYPNSAKAKKYFLVLMTGGAMPLPAALTDGSENSDRVQFTKRRYFKIFFVGILNLRKIYIKH